MTLTHYKAHVWCYVNKNNFLSNVVHDIYISNVKTLHTWVPNSKVDMHISAGYSYTEVICGGIEGKQNNIWKMSSKYACMFECPLAWYLTWNMCI